MIVHTMSETFRYNNDGSLDKRYKAVKPMVERVKVERKAKKDADKRIARLVWAIVLVVMFLLMVAVK